MIEVADEEVVDSGAVGNAGEERSCDADEVEPVSGDRVRRRFGRAELVENEVEGLEHGCIATARDVLHSAGRSVVTERVTEHI